MVALCALAQAAAPDKPAYDIVKTAERFAIGRVGEAGIISEQESALRELLKQPDAIARCQKLLGESTPAGQLYALLGLRLLDESAFKAALPRHIAAKTDIQTVSGCIITHTTAAALAQKIANGEVQ